MEESTKIGIFAIAGLSLLAIGAYVFREKLFKNKTSVVFDKFLTQEVEVLSLKEVVTFFKDQKLNSLKDTPFLSSNSSETFKGFSEKKGYKTMLAGVYNESKDGFKLLKVYYYIKLSPDLIAIMGDEELVILS